MGKLLVICIIGILFVASTQAWGWSSDEGDSEPKTQDQDDEELG
jgi:hypothetical protein